MNTFIPVSFRGTTLTLVNHDNQPYVAMRPVIEGMGLDWASQYTKLKANEKRWSVVIITTVAEDGKQRSMMSLPLRKLPGWLMTLHPNKVDRNIRENVINYQNECDDVLWEFWNKGAAVHPASTTISTAQAGELATLIAERFPTGTDRAYAWSRFNQHFRIARYRELPASQFAEACEYISTMPMKSADHPIPQLFAEHYPRFNTDAFMQVRAFIRGAQELAKEQSVNLPGSTQPETTQLASLLIYTCLQERWMLGFDNTGRMTMRALARGETTVNLDSAANIEDFVHGIPEESLPAMFHAMSKRMVHMVVERGKALIPGTSA